MHFLCNFGLIEKAYEIYHRFNEEVKFDLEKKDISEESLNVSNSC